ncbi:MAG: MCP four helix bundle domain-containing protein, partial [Gammaproteobacteria bacterium]|nr:MCP four helix bundle domain-containing protein [Gammaproteobacteria bacterium]
MALLVFLLGGFSLQQMTTMQRESVEVSEHWLPAILRMGDVNQQFLRIRAATLRLLLADTPTNQRAAVVAIEKTKVEFRQAREEVDPLIRTAEGRSIITRFDKAMADYERFQTQIVELALKGDLDGARALTRGELNQHADAASQAVGDLIALSRGKALEAARLSDETASSAFNG